MAPIPMYRSSSNNHTHHWRDDLHQPLWLLDLREALEALCRSLRHGSYRVRAGLNKPREQDARVGREAQRVVQQELFQG
jgi:hypothetical protein